MSPVVFYTLAFYVVSLFWRRLEFSWRMCANLCSDVKLTLSLRMGLPSRNAMRVVALFSKTIGHCKRSFAYLGKAWGVQNEDVAIQVN